MNIGIIGGGCSGALVAVHLLQNSSQLTVRLIEPRSDLARGLAYSTACPDHLLNVPAGNMSALPACPSQFYEWLKVNGYPDAGPDFFASRQEYGKYLGCLLESPVKSKPESFFWHSAEAVDIDCVSQPAIHLTLSDGTTLDLDCVILAIGNPPPARLVVSGLNPGQDRYYGSAWQTGALDCPQADSPVLLVGSGLTAIDAVVALRSCGHRGVIYMVSRHGQIPHSHSRYQEGYPQPPVQPDLPLRAMVRAVRVAADRAADWRTVIDGLRTISNQAWSGFTMAERSRFLRHLKVYWDVHRHRMAPQLDTLLRRAQWSGEVEGIAGRLRRVSAKGEYLTVEVALRGGGERTITVGRIVNCTGPGRDYRREGNPILQSLFRWGVASPGPLGAGLSTNEHGALIDAEGRPSTRLFTIGPPRTGDLFETIAVPEIREQAEALAAYVTARYN
jgi:uncharacterized NAD(P)/FAD-binding protein YdhS